LNIYFAVQNEYNDSGDYNMAGFIPFKYEKIVVSIRIDRDMLCDVDRLASEIDISRNQMIIQCIEYALKNSKKEG